MDRNRGLLALRWTQKPAALNTEGRDLRQKGGKKWPGIPKLCGGTNASLSEINAKQRTESQQ